MGAAVSGLVFQPPVPTPLIVDRRERLQVKTKHGTEISAFFINRSEPLTVLFSHGNAEDLGMIYDWFKAFAAIVGVNLLAYDYTGYGMSRIGAHSKPSEQQVYQDIEAIYEHLTTVLHIPPSQIVLYGRSLGSGPTCYLAQKLSKEGTPCAGVILQSPLLSAYRVAFNFRFTMLGDMFPNIDRMGDITCPVLLIHGTRDEVVPFWHGQELFLACQKRYRARPFWVDGAGHNNLENLLRGSGTFHQCIRAFVDEHCFGQISGGL